MHSLNGVKTQGLVLRYILSKFVVFTVNTGISILCQ